MKRPSTQRTETAAALGRWRTNVETAFGREVGRRMIAEARESISAFRSSASLLCAWEFLEERLRQLTRTAAAAEKQKKTSLRAKESKSALEGEKKQWIAE